MQSKSEAMTVEADADMGEGDLGSMWSGDGRKWEEMGGVETTEGCFCKGRRRLDDEAVAEACGTFLPYPDLLSS